MSGSTGGHRPAVINGERATNAEVPRSGAVAHQLNAAAEERSAAAAAKTGDVSEWHRERAWTRLGMARHGETVGDGFRYDRMAAGERAIERHHARPRTQEAGRGERTNEAPAPDAPARRRVQRPVSADTGARETTRLAQEQARTATQSAGHSR